MARNIAVLAQLAYIYAMIKSMKNTNEVKTNTGHSKEKEAHVLKGSKWLVIPFSIVLLLIFAGLLFAYNRYFIVNVLVILLVIIGIVLVSRSCKIIPPNMAMVFTYFGNYVGTTKYNGFIVHNPLYKFTRISTKHSHISSERIKVNDLAGNPIELEAVAVWNVADTYAALYDVEYFEDFITVQFESGLRQMASLYPYDNHEQQKFSNTLSLRKDIDEINAKLTEVLQARVKIAGIHITEARLIHIAYAPEVASLMLKRQQASAIISAQAKLVEGSVDMVKLAIDELNKSADFELSVIQQVQMAKNLMMALNSDQQVSPIIRVGHHTK